MSTNEVQGSTKGTRHKGVRKDTGKYQWIKERQESCVQQRIRGYKKGYT